MQGAFIPVAWMQGAFIPVAWMQGAFIPVAWMQGAFISYPLGYLRMRCLALHVFVFVF
jgi:hypothetical protein